MRRVIGLVLTGLGTFLIVVAVLLPTWVSGKVIKFPLNEYETATLDASNASYFSAASLSEKTGVSLQATYTIKGDAAAGNSSTAVWNEYSYVYDLTSKQAVQQMTRRFAFDRKTAKLVNCCGANVNGDSSVQQTGYVGYVFPIGTQKQTYDIFDTSLNKPVPFAYSGTTTIHGIQAYEFVENVAPVQVTTLQVPGSLVGESAATVTAPEYYQIHLVYDVDPETGALIDVNEHLTQTLRNPATGAQALLLFDADLIATPATVSSVVALDSSGRNELSLLETILPPILGIVGGIALVAGVLLGRRPRDEMGAELDAMARKFAVASSEERAAAHSRSTAEVVSEAAEARPGTAEPRPGTAEANGTRADLAGVVPGLDPPADERTAEAAAPPSEPEGPEAPGGQARG
jgi:hypothetical protein